MPILVEGKRERKPNIRLKDLFASKEKPSAEAAQAAARQSGKNILHKAKLRLNQTALNKSKTDLAKKLQRDMKTAETAATQQESAAALKTKRPQFAPLGALAGQISPLKLTGAESPSQARAGSSRKGMVSRACVLEQYMRNRCRCMSNLPDLFCYQLSCHQNLTLGVTFAIKNDFMQLYAVVC